MKIIIEDDDEENKKNIEIRLTQAELEKLMDYQSLQKDIGNALSCDRDVNIYIGRSHASQER